MGQQYDTLTTRLGEITDLLSATSVLSWDQETYMPRAAAAARGEQQATLSRIAHEMFTAPVTGRLLRAAAKEEDVAADPDSDAAAVVRVTQRDLKRETRLPGEFVAEMARTQAQAQAAWVEARQRSDFKQFEPWLVKVFELTRRAADYLGYKEHPYDALLDHYEPGMKTAQVRAIFADLRDETVPLVHAIAAKAGAVSDACLHGHFPRDRQEAFARRVSQQFGFDFARGRLDYSAHPFCTTFNHQDVRMTMRVDESRFGMLLFGVLHETGHGLYEQGIRPVFDRTPLYNGTSLGMHESQSRMWENLVGRSREFWSRFYPDLQAAFPESLGQASLDDFYRAINQVTPSFIRVQADEVTYNLHIMLRFELETELLEGKLRVAELPEAWNARMQSYLGITPPDDARGVLQDVHWSSGLVGYFPTYALGNLMSVQLYEQALKDEPGIKDDIAAGRFDRLLGWLRDRIHQHGRKYTAPELMKRVTGRKLTAAPYVRYLKRKYGKIYGL